MATTATLQSGDPELQAQIESALELQRHKTLAELIEDRQKLLEQDPERQNWLARTKEVIRYCRPDLSEYLGESDSPTQRGSSNTRYMYTSRPVIDLERAADAFCGNVFMPHGWFGLEMADPRLSGKQAVPELAGVVDRLQTWLQSCEEHLYAVYAGSNYYGVMPSLAMDALSIGDGLLYVGNDLDEGLPYFDYRDALGTWWQRNRYGRLTTIHERISLTAGKAYERWGQSLGAAAKLDVVRDMTKSHTFLHVVYRADDPILEGLTLRKAGKRRFIELWIEEGAKENQGHSNSAYEGALDRMGGIIQQEGYFTMPYADWPYWLKSGDTMGRGPLGSAIYTLKRCHAEHKQAMLAGQMSVRPPIWASAALEGRIDQSPGGVTHAKNTQTDIVRELLPGGVRYPFGIDQLDRTEKEIADALQLDFFLMMSMATKQMTIPEVVERVGEKAAALAPRLGLLQTLCLNQIHARVWQIEELHRRLPTPPDAYYELQAEGVSMAVSVRYKGPLSQAQEQMFMQRQIQTGFASAAPFAEMDPVAVRAKIDAAQGIEEAFDKVGLSHLVRSDEDYEAIMAGAQDAAAAQQQVEVAQQLASAGRDVAQAEQANGRGGAA